MTAFIATPSIAGGDERRLSDMADGGMLARVEGGGMLPRTEGGATLARLEFAGGS